MLAFLFWTNQYVFAAGNLSQFDIYDAVDGEKVLISRLFKLNGSGPFNFNVIA
ncbi:MAG: hypothetical protein ACI89S_002542, partial [Gammaproteobacteria bacterium]